MSDYQSKIELAELRRQREALRERLAEARARIEAAIAEAQQKLESARAQGNAAHVHDWFVCAGTYRDALALLEEPSRSETE